MTRLATDPGLMFADLADRGLSDESQSFMDSLRSQPPISESPFTESATDVLIELGIVEKPRISVGENPELERQALDIARDDTLFQQAREMEIATGEMTNAPVRRLNQIRRGLDLSPVERMPDELLDGRAANALKQSLKGFAHTANRAVEGVGDLADAVSELVGIDWEQPSDFFEASRNVISAYLPDDPRLRKEFLSSQLPQGIGSTLGFIAFAASGGAPGLVAAGVSIGAQEQAERARELESAPTEKAVATLLGGTLGLTESALPLRFVHAIKPFNQLLGGKLFKWIMGGLEKGGVPADVAIEAIQEAFQTLGSNVIARTILKDNAPLFDNVQESGEVGAGVGFFFGLLRKLAGFKAPRMKSSEAQKGVDQLKARLTASGYWWRSAKEIDDEVRGTRGTEGTGDTVTRETPEAQKEAQRRQSTEGQAEVTPQEAKILADHEQRAAAGQKDPTPNQEAFTNLGYEKMTRKERHGVVEDIKRRSEAGAESSEEASIPPPRAKYAPPGTTAEDAGFEAAADDYGFQKDFSEAETEAGGVIGRTVRTMPMPELVQLARRLLGKFPKISKKLRTSLGVFRHTKIPAEHGGDGTSLVDILINPKIADDPVVLAQVLAHEIGHLIDYLPHRTLKRGNLVGRLLSLRENIEEFVQSVEGGPGALTPADIARLEEIARSEQLQDFEQKVDLFITRELGITPKDVLNIWNATADVVVNKELEDYIKKLDTKGKKSIVGQALKGKISGQLKSFVQTIRTSTGVSFTVKGKIPKSIQDLRARVAELIQEEIKKRMLLSERVVRKELLALTEWWRGPIDPLSSPAYQKYRRSGKELYADALSVLLNAPGELKARAPEFFRGFMEFAGRKPEVIDTYLELQDILAGSSEELSQRRREIRSAMYKTAEQKINSVRLSKEAAAKSTGESVRQFFEQHFFDRLAPSKTVARMSVSRDAEYVLDELYQIDNDTAEQFNRIDDVLGPLREAGITNDDLGDYLLLRRVMNDRHEIANPLGYTAIEAEKEIAAMKKRLGEVNFSMLETAMQKFHDIAFETAERAVEHGIYSQKLFDDVIKPNKDNYATFAVIKYLEDNISSAIWEQVGTFEEVANPFLATLMKLVTTNRFIVLNKSKALTANSLKEVFPGEITKKSIPHGSPVVEDRPKPGYEYLYVREDGETVAYEVAEEIAKSFKSHDIGGLHRLATVAGSFVYKIYHPLFVTYNPGFGLQNILRDTGRTWKELGTVGSAKRKAMMADMMAQGATKEEAAEATKSENITFGQVLHALVKAVPIARRRAMGVSDPTVNRMLREKSLAIPYTSIQAHSDEVSQTDALLTRFTPQLTDVKGSSFILRHLNHALGGLRHFNDTVESASKIAADMLLSERTYSVAERSYIVRKHSGTPDVGQRGLSTALTNGTLTYSKVRANAAQAAYRLATNPKTASGYWWRSAVASFLPKLIKYGALIGFFGDWLKEWFGKVDDYYLANYNVIPLGTVDNKDGEEVPMFLTVAPADMDRFLGAVFWRGLNFAYPVSGSIDRENQAKALLGELYGEAIPQPNPIISAISKWTQFGTGTNPMDTFFNEPIVPQRSWDAGGWESLRKMLSWQVSQFGIASTISHSVTGPLLGEPFNDNDEMGIQTVLRSIPGLRRVVRISDRGKTSREWSRIENEDAEQARFRLNLPRNVQDLTGERHFLSRRGPDHLNDKEKADRLVYNAWYGQTYLPLTKDIRDAEDAGKDASALRVKLERETRDTVTWRTSGVADDYATSIWHGFASKLPTDKTEAQRRANVAAYVTESKATKEEALESLKRYYKMNSASSRKAFRLASRRLLSWWPE